MESPLIEELLSGIRKNKIMKESEKEMKDFFECMGEIWRDITALEFLMRGALAQKNGDVNLWPQTPYTKGKSYTQYPKSFSLKYFDAVAKEFNKEFPILAIPQKLIDFRNAMAHGCISKINHSEIDELIKFRKQNDNTLQIEFSMPLKIETIKQIRQSLMELRRYIALEASDKPKNKK